MLILEIEYLSYLCKMSLTVNNQLSNRYDQYSDASIQENLNITNNDNELDDFLIKLVDSAEYWTDIETAKRYDSLIINYYRLTDLIRYMHHIGYLMKNHSIMLEEKFFNNPKLRGYQLEDSRLVSFAIDSRNLTCSITLENVLIYNDKQINRMVPVDCGTIVLILKNTERIEVKGEISTVCPEANIVYKWLMIEMDDKLMMFSLLILIGNRHFVLQAVHSDIEVLSYKIDL